MAHGPSARRGGVSNVDRDGKNTLQIKAIGATISTFETRPKNASSPSTRRESSG
jgi:hypothetical protein